MPGRVTTLAACGCMHSPSAREGKPHEIFDDVTWCNTLHSRPYICNLGPVVSSQQDVHALQVKVNDAVLVEVDQPLGNVKRNLGPPANKFYQISGGLLIQLS